MRAAEEEALEERPAVEVVVRATSLLLAFLDAIAIAIALHQASLLLEALPESALPDWYVLLLEALIHSALTSTALGQADGQA